MRFGILRQWWHLPVVGGLILDAVRDLYGQLLFRHNEVYLLLRIQEKHILCCVIGQNLVILPAKMQKNDFVYCAAMWCILSCDARHDL